MKDHQKTESFKFGISWPKELANAASRRAYELGLSRSAYLRMLARHEMRYKTLQPSVIVEPEETFPALTGSREDQ